MVILGAAGRDFHNFNVVFRDNPLYRVVAFTAAQIPGTADRTYPPALAGKLYPRGIPVLGEERLPNLLAGDRVDLVVLAYSDLPHADVMHKASIALAGGASFALLGPDHTMLRPSLPVIAVCAVRTGAGKSPTSRSIVRWALQRGYRPAVIRHPMPYGDPERQAVQCFRNLEDLDEARCTIEEREEYEPYLRLGVPVFAGVDYARIVKLAQDGADFILWDGGNNDFPFVRPDLLITLVDPHRAGHELAYHPGEANFRMADLLIVSKADSAPPEGLYQVRENIRLHRPDAEVVEADLVLSVEQPDLVRGKRVLAIEDGPTLTHGGASTGGGVLAARQLGAEPVDPRPWAQGSFREVFAAYPHIGPALPTMGYSPQQVRDLEATIRAVPCDVVLDASPVDLSRLVSVDKPIVQVEYELRERGDALARALEGFAGRHLKQRRLA